MFQETPDELAALADELYEASDDDDEKLAGLLRTLPEKTAQQLCTSNYTNALQAYLYAFGSTPAPDIYDRLLLEPSSMLLYGIKIKSVELADLIFGFDKRSQHFFIGVYDGEKIIAAFAGEKAYETAADWAREHCR